MLAGDAGGAGRHPRLSQPDQQVVADLEVAATVDGATSRERRWVRQSGSRTDRSSMAGVAVATAAPPPDPALRHGSHEAQSPAVLEHCAGLSARVLPGGGAGGARTHDPGIMSPML